MSALDLVVTLAIGLLVLFLLGLVIACLHAIVESYSCLRCGAPQGRYLRGECCDWAAGEYERLHGTNLRK